MTDLELRVVGIDDSVPHVRTVELARPDNAPLPAIGPGSHVVVQAGERRNAYSLTGDVRCSGSYRISVRHQRDGAGGAGGSAWIHGLAPGAAVRTSAPRNLFAPVATARHSVYVAGGIGITPLLSHVREAVRHGRSFELVYVTPSTDAAPHLAELRTLAGPRLRHIHGRRAAAGVLDRLFGDQPIGTYAYVCGPPGLTADVLALARGHGWPDERLRFEPFAAEPSPPGGPFTARLVRRNRTVDVAADQSLLDALADAGVEIDHLCRQGLCGECIVPVVSGRIEHRDHVLSAAERATGRSMMACVSRAEADLELEL